MNDLASYLISSRHYNIHFICSFSWVLFLKSINIQNLEIGYLISQYWEGVLEHESGLQKDEIVVSLNIEEIGNIFTIKERIYLNHSKLVLNKSGIAYIQRLDFVKKLRHGCSTCVAKVRKKYASLLLPSPKILEECKL